MMIGIMAEDNANSDAGSNLTEQIHEMFFNNEISDVCIMRPVVLDHYVSDGLESLWVAFEGLDNKNTVIMIKARMSCTRWDITFQIHTTKLKTMAQVCEMSAMGVINEVHDIDFKPDIVNWETSLMESPDMSEGLRQFLIGWLSRLCKASAELHLCCSTAYYTHSVWLSSEV
jgi:hypothetical protein